MAAFLARLAAGVHQVEEVVAQPLEGVGGVALAHHLLHEPAFYVLYAVGEALRCRLSLLPGERRVSLLVDVAQPFRIGKHAVHLLRQPAARLLVAPLRGRLARLAVVRRLFPARALPAGARAPHYGVEGRFVVAPAVCAVAPMDAVRGLLPARALPAGIWRLPVGIFPAVALPVVMRLLYEGLLSMLSILCASIIKIIFFIKKLLLLLLLLLFLFLFRRRRMSLFIYINVSSTN